MPPLSVTIPPEPDDRAVVLDRDADAWQRHGERWYPTHAPDRRRTKGLAWGVLIVEWGPLAPLVTEAEQPVDGWARAGYTDPSLEHYAQPIGTTPRHERTDATAGDCATSRRGADDGLPRVWSEGDAEPEDVAEVRDTDSHVWRRLGGDEMRHPWQREDEAADASWSQLLSEHGPVVEPIPHALAPAGVLPPQGRFVEATEPAPIVGGRAFEGFGMPPVAPLPAHLRRAVRDIPQA